MEYEFGVFFQSGVYLSKQCKVYQESQLYPEGGKKRQLEKCNSRFKNAHHEQKTAWNHWICS